MRTCPSTTSWPCRRRFASRPQSSSVCTAGGNILGGYYKWYNKTGNFPHTGSILISANQVPYDWWAGFHEFRYTDKPLTTKEDWLKGVVHPYSQRRVLSFFDWAATKWDIDRTRTFLVGASMGGGGSSMMALHHGELLAWLVSHVGIHVPRQAGEYNVAYAHNYGARSTARCSRMAPRRGTTSTTTGSCGTT